MTEPESFNIELSDPASTRWTHVQSRYCQQIQRLVEHYCSEELLEKAPSLFGSFDDEQREELEGLSSASGISYAQAVLLNFIYEQNAHCTSIIYKSSEGQIVMGRNLDYFADSFLKETLVHLKVHREGKLIYESVGFAWYLGVGTAIKPGAFAVSQNQRKSGPLVLNIDAFMNKHELCLWAVRKAMILCSTYQEAVDFLNHAKVAAPTYYAVAGITEGSIVTLGRAENLPLCQIRDDFWFEVQTNHDIWNRPPLDDNRREVAREAILSIGRSNFTAEKLREVLAIKPVRNKMTVFATIMVPENGLFKTLIYES